MAGEGSGLADGAAQLCGSPHLVRGPPTDSETYAAKFARIGPQVFPGHEQIEPLHRGRFGREGLEAFHLEYSWQPETGPRVASLQAFAAQGSRGYYATLYAKAHEFEEERSTMVQVLRDAQLLPIR